MEFLYPEIRRPIKQEFQIKPFQRSLQEFFPQEKTALFYIGGVQGNTYFYSGGYYGGCDKVGCAKNFKEHRYRWHGLGEFTGVAIKTH